MISHGKLGTAKIKPASAKFRHRRVDRQQCFCGDRPQRDYRFRFDGCDLPHQKWRASLALITLRRAVSRRTALDNVCNVNIFPTQAHRLDHVIEQLTGTAHEWLALHIFIRSRSFSDKHEISFRIAHAEHDLLAPLFMQHTTRAIAEVFSDQAQRLRRIDHIQFWLRPLRTNLLLVRLVPQR